MYIQDGIVYAGDYKPVLKVVSVRPMETYLLCITFSTGETKIFDCKPLLQTGVFRVLSELSVFNAVYLEHGAPTWCNGSIDIAPEWLYEDGIILERQCF
jgi:hypothetical protein